LVTSLLDPATAPAIEIAYAYHERWEIELVIDEVDELVVLDGQMREHIFDRPRATGSRFGHALWRNVRDHQLQFGTTGAEFSKQHGFRFWVFHPGDLLF
jgi:hypothetical protein